MMLIKRSVVFFFLFSTVLLGVESELRMIQFSVYGQFPIHGVYYQSIPDRAPDPNRKIVQEPVKIRTHSLSRCGPYELSGAGVIQFFEQNDDGERNSVGRVVIPQSSNKWLFIFIPNPKFDPIE